MRENDRQLGKPLRAYVDNRASIEALSLVALDEGCIGYASDIDAFGSFDGATWSWLTVPTGAGAAALGAGTATQLAYWSGTTTLTGSAGLTYASDKIELVSSLANKPVLQIENTGTGSTAPTIDFYKNSATPADSDDLGAIDFFGEDSGGVKTRYAYILSESLDVTNGDEAGGLVFEVRMDNTSRNLLELAGYNGAVNEGEVIVNEEGQDVDFRVEAVGETHALFVRGSDGHVGAGASNPATVCELEETITLAGDVADDYAAALTLDPAYTGAHTVTRHNYIDVQDVNIAGGAAVTDAAVLRFNNAIGGHSALAAAFQTTDSGGDTTDWATGIIININGVLYKLPAVAL